MVELLRALANMPASSSSSWEALDTFERIPGATLLNGLKVTIGDVAQVGPLLEKVESDIAKNINVMGKLVDVPPSVSIEKDDVFI